jgi:oxalate decarboxylase/phosphoglucose isomerase-like protein (cupin superfamily)
MHTLILRSTLIALLLLLPFKSPSPQNAAAPQMPATTPSADHPALQRTPQFENDDVAVWKTVVPPNAPLTMHTHQHPRVIVALSGGTMKVVYEDGASETHDWKSGQAYWLPKSEGMKRHADVNTGDKPIEVMVVELKRAD